ncbi:MAG: hypothetical protein ACPG8K_03645, partial [Crocinitomicaceae bacterium]
MKKIIFTALVLSVYSCSSDNRTRLDSNENNPPETNIATNFTFEGSVEGASNEMFYIEAATNRGVMTIGKGLSDSNGSFSINSNIQGFGEYYLRMGESNEKIVPMVLVPGDNVAFSSNSINFMDSAKFEGTRWSEVASNFIPIYKSYTESIQNLRTTIPGSTELEQLEASFVLKRPVEKFAFEQMVKEPNNPFNLVLF